MNDRSSDSDSVGARMFHLLDIAALAGSSVLIAMITTLKPDDESGYQAQETDDKTNRWPIPMVQIH
ncbi:MAG: hypothetical protein V3R35_00195 [Woeseiaceae bacterium]